MELRQLRYFVEVVRHGSITAASAEIFVSQPALSVALRKLEADVGAPLLDRSPGGVTLTPAGLVLLPRAEAILGQADDAAAAARAAAGGGPQLVRLAIPPLVGMRAILQVLEDFAPAHPELDVTITEVGTRDVIAGLDQGRFDIGVAIDHGLEHSHVEWARLRVPVMAVVAEASPLAAGVRLHLADLDGEAIAAMGAGAFITDVVATALRASGARPRLVHTTVQLSMLVELARRGVAIGFVPESVAAELSGVRILPIEPPLVEEVVVLRTRALEVSASAHLLMDRLTAAVDVS